MLVSAPGKVLFAGGYLVLDPAYGGLVLASAARFYTHIRPSSSYDRSSSSSVRITVYAPQFVNAVWPYDASLDPENTHEWRLEPAPHTPANPFVQLAVLESIRLASALTSSAAVFDIFTANKTSNTLSMFVLADNDFYSQTRNESSPPPFAHLARPIADARKTGLGSSAALVTSIAGAILIYTKAISTVHDPILHNLAQYIHSLAQHKVGSGFDISAAVHGSHIYYRFHPSILDPLLESAADNNKPSSDALLKTLHPDHNPDWLKHPPGPAKESFGLPPYTTLVLADVDAGTNTPSFVSTLLRWAKAYPSRAQELFKHIDSINRAIANAFIHLSKAYEDNPSEYLSDFKRAATQLSSEWTPSSETMKVLIETRDILKSFRTNMKTMGDESTVPIEPNEQTLLLDGAQSSCPGVLGQAVPGAGGYDAIWSLVLSPPEVDVTSSLESYFMSYKQLSVRPLSAASRVKGYHGSSEESAATTGARVEDIEKVAGFNQAIAKYL